jgi:hypothetical protein
MTPGSDGREVRATPQEQGIRQMSQGNEPNEAGIMRQMSQDQYAK